MDDSEHDFTCYLKDIEKCNIELVPKWHEFVFHVPEKDRWKLALILENTEHARSKSCEASFIDSSAFYRNNIFLNKAAIYDVADWFLNFPFRDIISMQPVSQPCALAYQRLANGELLQDAVSVQTRKEGSIRSAFIDEVVIEILKVADYPVVAVQMPEIENYEKTIIGPPDTKIIAILRGNKTNIAPESFDFRYENGHRVEDNGRITIFIDGLPVNEVIYCFSSHSDVGAPISIHPYVMSLLAPLPMSRAVVHAFKGAGKFFHRIRII